MLSKLGSILTSLKLTHRQATAFLIMTAVLWSMGGLLIKSVDWNPLAIAGTRSAIAALLFWAVIGRPRFNWTGAQIGSALAYAGTVILFVLANKLTTAANAILLQYTSPVWVALFANWFLGEKTRMRDWLTLALVFCGMGLFFLDELSSKGTVGNLVAIASGVSFAWLALFMRKQKDESTLESVLLGNITAAVLCLPGYFVGPFPSTSGWLALLVLGVVQIGASYLLFSVAVKFVSAIETMLIPVVEPILNPIWVMLFMGERPGRWAIIGGSMVLAAVTARGLLSGGQRREGQPGAQMSHAAEAKGARE